jgi:hypothetical protein
MGCAVWAVTLAIPDARGVIERLAVVGGGGAAGLLIYGALIQRFQVPEVQLVWDLTWVRIRALVSNR